MASKICVWIVVIYRLVNLSVVLTVGTVNLQGAVGPWGLLSQWQDLCTSYVTVFGVWSQAAEIPSVMSAASDFSPYGNSVAVSWSKTCFEYVQEEEM